MTNEATVSEPEITGDGHDSMDITAIGWYLFWLTVATSSTFIFAHWAIWGPFKQVLFTMMVSTCKASLVVGYFMHLKYELSWKWLLTIPPCILAVVCVLALLPDVSFPVYEQLSWQGLRP